METTDKLSEFAVQTPTGFICKLCSREFDDRRRIICHLAKIKCNEVDDCPLVPEDVDKQLRQQLKLSRKRDSTSTHHSKRAAFSTRGLHLLATQVVGKQFDDYIGDIWSSLMCFGLAFVELEVLEKLSLPSILITSSFTVPTTFIMFSGLICLLLLIHFVICKLVFPWQWVYIYPMKMMKPKGQQNWQNCWLEKEKSLLILDDLWDFISLQDVGVPVGADGFTVLFTTRSLGVCRKVGCQREIEVHCLPPDESYELFKKELGKETTLSTEVEEMSRLVADKCFGLPFAITIMAREMKGVTDKHRWRNALSGQMRKKADMEIFQKLKITYEYLKDPTLQHCFLCCASLVDRLLSR